MEKEWKFEKQIEYSWISVFLGNGAKNRNFHLFLYLDAKFISKNEKHFNLSSMYLSMNIQKMKWEYDLFSLKLVLLAFFLCSCEAKTVKTCLNEFRKEIQITEDMINDDYCDCWFDGQDEPETSACSHLQASRFICKNENYIPVSISSTRYHDGVCCTVRPSMK